MKRFFIVLLLWAVHIFPNTIDEINFLTLNEQVKLNSICDTIYKKTKITTNLIIIDSRLKLSKKSFYGSKNSIFIVLMIEDDRIIGVNLFTSTNVAINNLYRHEFDQLLDNNTSNNKTLHKLEIDGVPSLTKIAFYNEYRNKQLIFIESLLINSKNFYIPQKFSLNRYLKNHLIILCVSFSLIALLLIKFLLKIIKSKKE